MPTRSPGDGMPLNLPPAPLKTVAAGGRVKVFDPLRGKYVALTPEEFVRQHFVHYLISALHYPAPLMANEVGIELHGTRKRCDTVVYGPDGQPAMIIEYKAPDVALSQSVFDQIVRYNMRLRVRWLVVSNGLQHYCCEADYSSGSYRFLAVMPDYRHLSGQQPKA